MAEHGTNARYNDGCRCGACAQAHRDTNNHRMRMIAYGRWDPWVDADEVRTHVRSLMAEGVGFKKVAQVAGVSRWTLERLLYGSSDGPPPKRMRKDVGSKILAVRWSLDLVSDVASVDSAGTVRRIQALGCMGHSHAAVASRVGADPEHFGRIRRTGRVSAGLARRVAAVYDELWDVWAEGRSADRARLAAKRFGWLSPLAWDDNLIDLPDAELAEEVARQIAAMDEAELQRCHRAHYALGDRSPVIAGAAREWEQRKRAARRARQGVAA